MSDIRVSIVEDQGPIREGLSTLINGTPGYRCVGRYQSMEEALPGIRRDPPDVALVDLGLPGMGGIEGIRRLKQQDSKLLVVVLTVYDDDRRIFQAMCAGACGYLLKKTPPNELMHSIREVLDGGAPMTPGVARRVIELFRDCRPPAQCDYQLTPHEKRLLDLLVKGHNYKTAAQALDVSVNTVRFHLRTVYQKLQVHSKSQAVSKALREGIVQ